MAYFNATAFHSQRRNNNYRSFGVVTSNEKDDPRPNSGQNDFKMTTCPIFMGTLM